MFKKCDFFKKFFYQHHITLFFHTNYFLIAENKKIDDFFDLEEINDEEYMDFHFSMCDVGDEYGNPDRYKSKE